MLEEDKLGIVSAGVWPAYCDSLFPGEDILDFMIVPTLFHEWYYPHYTLANGIWYAMLVLVVASWVVSIVQNVREWF